MDVLENEEMLNAAEIDEDVCEDEEEEDADLHRLLDLQQGKKKKLKWHELRSIVSELRRDLVSLSTMVPSSFTFRTLQDGRIRIYFLSTPQNGWETTLLFTDINMMATSVSDDSMSMSMKKKLHWQCVLESNFPSIVTSCQKSSREEQLLWERKRLTTWGLNSYEMHGNSGKIIFPASSSLFQCVDTGFTNGQLFPTKLRMTSSGAKLSPQICPSNPELVAYICNHDIWVTHTVSGSNVRMTYAHKGGRTLSDDPFSAGVPSYVMQEEFCRYQGYWWQCQKTTGDIYRILYEEIDDSDVKVFCFPSSSSGAATTTTCQHDGEGEGELNGQNVSNNSGGMDSDDFEEFRFPRAGQANSKSTIKMIEFNLNEHLQIVNLKLCALVVPLKTLFPWMEYLVRLGWTPNGDRIWCQLLDRRQQHLEVILLSLDSFSCCAIDEKTPTATAHQHHHHVQVIYMQDSQFWINVHDLLFFLPTSKMTDDITFLWANEDTGYRHLYVITSDLSDVNPLTARIKSKRQLTDGNWEVIGDSLWYDEIRQLVYFMALKDTPLEKHLYVISLTDGATAAADDDTNNMRRLTQLGYSYNVDFDRSCQLMISVYSNISEPPICQVNRIQHHNNDGIITVIPLGYLVEPSGPISAQYTPTLHVYEQHGQKFYAMVFKPHNYFLSNDDRKKTKKKKYPTILNIYGGPEVQLVSNQFKGMRQLRMHMLAARGYCVVAIDTRGSQHRGLTFEGYVKNRMGTVELADQVAVLKWLAANLGLIDMSRVAIHGWSYGGYLSLMGLCHYPEVFKVAVAGAPVTNWTFYDTGYTERYMDLPIYNPVGYDSGSVLKYVDRFPDEENRLLLIHGLIDENVHFCHTSQLISHLIRAGKPYQLQLYPNERHSLRHLDSSKHYETTLLSFLQSHL